MDEEPKSVKELLVEAKDASELMVDLAYAAVFFEDEKLAREVERLEERMIGHLRRLRMMAMLAARSPEDAEGMAGVLWIAGAVEKSGDAASDIARGVAARLGIPDALRHDLRHADEMTARVKVREGAAVIGRSLRELSLPTETGMWVMAIRSGIDWRFDPGPEDVSSEADVLLVRGPEEGVALVRELAGAPAPRARAPHPRRAPGPAPPGERQRVDVRRRARHDLVRRARRAAASRRPARARGDRGDERGDRGREGNARRRARPEGPWGRDRGRGVRAREPARSAMDLPTPGNLGAPRRRPADRRRTRGGGRRARRPLPRRDTRRRLSTASLHSPNGGPSLRGWTPSSTLRSVPVAWRTWSYGSRTPTGSERRSQWWAIGTSWSPSTAPTCSRSPRT